MAAVCGAIFFQALKSHSGNDFGKLIIIMMFMNNFSSSLVWNLDNTPKNIPIYFILIFLTAIFISGVNSFISTTDTRKRSKNDCHYLIILSVNRFLLRVVQIFNLVVCGYLIQNNPRVFIEYYTVVAVLCTVLLIIRKIRYPQSLQN